LLEGANSIGDVELGRPRIRVDIEVARIAHLGTGLDLGGVNVVDGRISSLAKALDLGAIPFLAIGIGTLSWHFSKPGEPFSAHFKTSNQSL